jgi:hypothetical protein
MPAAIGFDITISRYDCLERMIRARMSASHAHEERRRWRNHDTTGDMIDFQEAGHA